MPININSQLREHMTHDVAIFPISFFNDELASLPDLSGPLHWHPEFEIATAESGTLDFQVGQEHIILEAGDSIFVNGNVLHGIKQLSGAKPDMMPNIVFSGTMVAPETSVINQKYIKYIADCDSLPYIVFRNDDDEHSEINMLINSIYKEIREQRECYEMVVQRKLSYIFEYIFRNFDSLPKSENTRIQIKTQIRIQKMLSYIYEHYMEEITLEDIARAANISRSEAGRCFNIYMNCTPIDMLIKYRLQVAYELLSETALSLQEICCLCGFNYVNYFCRRFRMNYGFTPVQKRKLGK
ncbi:MAG: AraC family transcriptional regulator [Lachnospiraceae bacterium]|nr:AraC family transcriptional regulator [Lachnospiraceae bacterium]